MYSPSWKIQTQLQHPGRTVRGRSRAATTVHWTSAAPSRFVCGVPGQRHTLHSVFCPSGGETGLGQVVVGQGEGREGVSPLLKQASFSS